MKYKLIAILKIINLIIIPLTIFNVILYIIGSFIAWDTNPTNWLIFTTVLGRITFIFLEVLILVKTPDFWDMFE